MNFGQPKYGRDKHPKIFTDYTGSVGVITGHRVFLPNFLIIHQAFTNPVKNLITNTPNVFGQSFHHRSRIVYRNGECFVQTSAELLKILGIYTHVSGHPGVGV